MAQVQSLAWELPHATKQNKQTKTSNKKTKQTGHQQGDVLITRSVNLSVWSAALEPVRTTVILRKLPVVPTPHVRACDGPGPTHDIEAHSGAVPTAQVRGYNGTMRHPHTSNTEADMRTRPSCLHPVVKVLCKNVTIQKYAEEKDRSE